MSKKMFIIGPISSKGSIGGVTVLFDLLLHDLNNLKIDYDIFDSNAKNYSSKIAMYLRCVFKILHPFKYRNISLHGTAKDYLFFSVPLLLSKVLFFKSYSLRKFAGDFDNFFNSLSAIEKLLVSFLLKNSKVNFFETQKLVNFFSYYNENTHWFPNVRLASSFSSSNYKAGSFRVLFLSQLMRAKGVYEAVEAVRAGFKENITLDIYGPIIDVDIEELTKHEYINYKGVLDSDEVQETMSQYHTLLFPTYYSGEGYPGVIIEGFSVGIPIITTNWLSIPELFDTKDMLVEVNNSKMLERKLLEVKESHSFYKDLSLKNFSKFQSLKYTKLFVEKTNYK
ncbi:glycosyltransferase [Pseudoalteromonas neustonica]|uniref:Glycosyltransferase n=1 Tax=Pseudoalteromonas neustonica TaxID=1840331 RepID=A0ABU9U3V7_9GAMM